MRTGNMIGASLLAWIALCGAARGEATQVSESGSGAWLGITAQALGKGWRQQKNYWGKGVMVSEVAVGSPAEQAGIGPGDVLVSVASRTLNDPRDVAEVEGGLEPWQPVSVVLAKDGGRVTRIFQLEPAAAPTTADIAPAGSGADATDMAPSPAAAEEPVVAPVVITPPESETAAPPPPTVVLRDGLKDLGVQCEDLDVDLATAAGAPDGAGVLVLAVMKGSPAEAAGIVPGDVISWVAGATASDVEQVDRALSIALSPVPIAIGRHGTTLPLTVDFDAHAISANRAGHAKPSAAFEELRRDPLVNALRDEVRRLRAQVEMLQERLTSPAPVGP
jgi:membrane-associated protease RseP (regulator of RpoE activity)